MGMGIHTRAAASVTPVQSSSLPLACMICEQVACTYFTTHPPAAGGRNKLTSAKCVLDASWILNGAAMGVGVFSIVRACGVGMWYVGSMHVWSTAQRPSVSVSETMKVSSSCSFSCMSAAIYSKRYVINADVGCHWLVLTPSYLKVVSVYATCSPHAATNATSKLNDWYDTAVQLTVKVLEIWGPRRDGRTDATSPTEHFMQLAHLTHPSNPSLLEGLFAL
jgi:hypothetical protein